MVLIRYLLDGQLMHPDQMYYLAKTILEDRYADAERRRLVRRSLG